MIANMANEEAEWEETDPIPYQPCGSILTTLGFLPPTMAQDSIHFKLFKDLWNLLGGENSGGVEVENLLYLLLLIRGIRLPAREKKFTIDENKDYTNQSFLKRGMVDEAGKFIVKEGGQKKLFTHFKDLHFVRIDFEGKQK